MGKFKSIALATVLSATSVVGAHAATLNFVEYANTAGEHGVASGTTINFDGLDVTFSATKSDGAAPAYPYFDASSAKEVALGGAGLGVCQRLHSGLCVPGSDDNITIGEAVTLVFGKTVGALTKLLFNAEGHHAIADDLTLLFSLNGGAYVEKTFGELRSGTFLEVDSVSFAYGGSKADQFYLGGAVAAVPVPAAGLMLISAVGGLAAVRRRRQA